MLSERYGLPVINSPETGGILPGEWYMCVWEGWCGGKGWGEAAKNKVQGSGMCMCVDELWRVVRV